MTYTKKILSMSSVTSILPFLVFFGLLKVIDVFLFFQKSMTHRIFNSLGAPLSLEVNILILVNSKMKLGILGFSRSLITILITKKLSRDWIDPEFSNFYEFNVWKLQFDIFLSFQVRFPGWILSLEFKWSWISLKSSEFWSIGSRNSTS